MSTRYNQHNTIYGDYVRDTLMKFSKKGGGGFMFKGIADFLVLPPTHNLRKRLRTLEQQGYLTISYGYVGKCGTCLVYTIPDRRPEALKKFDIPF